MHTLPCLSGEALIGAPRKWSRVVGMEVIRAYDTQLETKSKVETGRQTSN